MWFDSHCHLQDQYLSDSDSVQVSLDEAYNEGVVQVVCVGTDHETSMQALDIATTHDQVWASVGLHPHEAKSNDEWIIPLVNSLERATREKLVGLGETGLDYYYEHSPRNLQKESFLRQVGYARDLDLTLVVHTRDAWDDTLEILGQEGRPDRVVIHCFTGGPDEAKRCLDLGAWISLSGIVTFPKSQDVQQAARIVPLDKLLLETDSPFLAPTPYRGKPNSPRNVARVGEFVANLRGLDPKDLAQITFENTCRAFSISPV